MLAPPSRPLMLWRRLLWACREPLMLWRQVLEALALHELAPPQDKLQPDYEGLAKGRAEVERFKVGRASWGRGLGVVVQQTLRSESALHRVCSQTKVVWPARL